MQVQMKWIHTKGNTEEGTVEIDSFAVSVDRKIKFITRETQKENQIN